MTNVSKHRVENDLWFKSVTQNRFYATRRIRVVLNKRVMFKALEMFTLDNHRFAAERRK